MLPARDRSGIYTEAPRHRTGNERETKLLPQIRAGETHAIRSGSHTAPETARIRISQPWLFYSK